MVNLSSPVFLFIGDEKYLKEKAIRELRSSLAASSSGDVDYKVFSGGETNSQEILDYVATIPFLAAQRIAVIKDFEELSPEDQSRLIAYIKKPSNHTCLVIDTHDTALLEKHPSLGRYLKTVKFAQLTEAELDDWIRRFLASKGKKIDPDALEILEELQGRILLSITQELEKLITFIGQRETIELRDVEELVGKSVMASTFDLAEAVGNKDPRKALGVVSDLIVSGKKSYEIVGLLCWYFKRMLKAQDLKARGESEESIAYTLKIGRRYSQDFFSRMYSFDRPLVEEKMKILLETDLSIKRARFDPFQILELAIIRLCLG